jgi:hypothetical protein
MKFESLPISVTASIFLGVIQWLLLTLIWTFIALYTPVPQWLVDLGILGSAFYSILFVSDFLLNILFCLPVAFVICRLRPEKIVLYTALAVVPAFVWTNRLLISEPERLTLFVPWYSFVPGWIFGLVSIPLAVFIVNRLTKRSSTFRPTASTERGSAAPLY